MARILWLWCAVSIGCGSGATTDEESAGAPAVPVPAPVAGEPAAAVEPPASPQEREREAAATRCRLADVEACARGATLSAELGDDARARELHELGCLHGAVASCRALVAVSEHWLGAACRRGDEDACRNAHRPRAPKFRVTAPKDGPVGERVRKTYSASIEDCAVREAGGGGEVEVTFSVSEGHTAEVVTTPPTGPFATCVGAAVARWVFLDAGAEPYTVAARFQPARSSPDEEAPAFADLLTSDGPIEPDTSPGGHRQPGGDLARELAELHKGDGPRTVRIAGAKAATPPGQIIIAAVKLFDDSSLTAGDITREIQRQHVAGLQRCYQARLKREPTAIRTVRVPFTIGANGRVTGAKPSSTPADGDLAACLASTVPSWRFPVPRDQDDEATDVDVLVELRLTP